MNIYVNKVKQSCRRVESCCHLAHLGSTHFGAKVPISVCYDKENAYFNCSSRNGVLFAIDRRPGPIASAEIRQYVTSAISKIYETCADYFPDKGRG